MYRPFPPLADFLEQEHRRAVWNKGAPISGWSARLWRRDRFGDAMHWPHYADRGSSYGWEIARRQASGIGAPDELDSFEPLQWRNHARQAAQQPPSDLQRWSR